MRQHSTSLKYWAALVLGLVGCSEKVESSDIKTSGIYPEFLVTATGNGSSKIEVWLKVGGNNSNTFLELTGPDELTVTVDGKMTAISEHSGNKYTATIPTDEGGTEFSFAFMRGGDGDAPVSTVTLPEPFSLDVLTEEAIREQDDVELAWDPPGSSGDVDYELDGDCIFRKTGAAPDNVGEYTIRASDIDGLSTHEMDPCTVDVAVTRARGGSLDSAFTEGGEISARQVRHDSFTSLPTPMP